MKIIYSKTYMKELDKILKSYPNSIKEDVKTRLELFIKCKKENIPLPKDYKDHKLNDNRRYRGYRDAHIKDDIVLLEDFICKSEVFEE